MRRGWKDWTPSCIWRASPSWGAGRPRRKRPFATAACAARRSCAGRWPDCGSRRACWCALPPPASTATAATSGGDERKGYRFIAEACELAGVPLRKVDIAVEIPKSHEEMADWYGGISVYVNAADSEGGIQTNRARRDDINVHFSRLAKRHDGALAEFLLDLLNGLREVLAALVHNGNIIRRFFRNFGHTR